jgi:O-antigen/teichoic acid export membrane protein
MTAILNMSSRRALAFSFLDRYAGLLLSIASSMIVARLLTPAEIGVFSVAFVVLSFISTMRDFGAGQYLVQEPDLTIERIRATWSVQLGLGLGFAAIALAAAVPVSRFYDEPRMRDIMILLSLNFAVGPFGSLTYAWLMREMRFDSLALMRFAGGLTGACVTVGMAWHGFGPISLAAGNLAATVANASIATCFRPSFFPWMPSLVGVRRVIAFGGKVSLTNVINTIGQSVPELVLGKAQGMVSVGLYSRANGLAGMFQRLILDATQAVAMPLFSKASREGEHLGPIFMRATSYVTAIGWSFFGVMIVLAFPTVRVLYGAQWDASVPLTRLVAAAMAIGLPAAFCPTAIMASGAMSLLVHITVLTVLQFATLVAIGSVLGVMHLAWAIVLATFISVFIWLCKSPVMREISQPQFLRMLLQSGCIAAVTIAASTLAFLWDLDGQYQHIGRLLIGLTSASVAFPIAVFALRHPLREEFRQLRVFLLRR